MNNRIYRYGVRYCIRKFPSYCWCKLITSIRNNLRKPTIFLYINCPSLWLLRQMQSINEIQLQVNELNVIINIIKSRAPCSFLIFGLGNDSIFWRSINRSGKTVFLEDNETWIRKVIKQDATIQVYLVDYKSQLTQWQEFINSSQLLNIDLPKEIEDESWDIILVDAPEGWCDDKPGRMKSIYLASRLGKNNSDIFVHDCDRQVERIYCNQFLKEKNLKAEVGKLRHYHLQTE